MDKQKIIEKLAIYYGLISEYTDNEGKIIKVSMKDCQEFLELIGINTENIDNLVYKSILNPRFFNASRTFFLSVCGFSAIFTEKTGNSLLSG